MNLTNDAVDGELVNLQYWEEPSAVLHGDRILATHTAQWVWLPQNTTEQTPLRVCGRLSCEWRVSQWPGGVRQSRTTTVLEWETLPEK